MDSLIQPFKKRSNSFLISMAGIFLFVFLIVTDIYTCPFKLILGIPCPGCGMTRAFMALLQFRFADAWNLNILSIPVFFGILLVSGLLFYDRIFNTSYVEKLSKFNLNYVHFSLLLLITFISWITNFTRSI